MTTGVVLIIATGGMMPTDAYSDANNSYSYVHIVMLMTEVMMPSDANNSYYDAKNSHYNADNSHYNADNSPRSSVH